MTKADIVSEIAKGTGIEKVQVQAVVEAFMESIKTSMTKMNNVYLRGFGSFIVMKRAQQVARLRSESPTVT
ncbi:MAG: HU family DNA-binding protein, partial [Alistipes sp.]|nr:HU family DNA-binding protein [Alistipes sp.]